ncbi:cytochrome P450 family protein [Micromonospora fulviviridis]|uniref:Cytochrome P450 n=1 Tax=Micromonospora fulviviridis TaxID=47860 RepID=A0ABV2VV07_9ACTN
MTVNIDPVRLLTRSFMADPYPALAHLREDHAAVPVENGGFRMWLITRYDDARTLLADPSLSLDLVKHRHRILEQDLVDIERRPKLPRELRRAMLDYDGADHRRTRRVVAKHFAPSQLATSKPRIERLADDLLNDLPANVPIDIVARYARPLSVAFISDLLGVPEGAREEFAVWEMALLTAPSKSEVEHAGRQLHKFADEMVALKHEQPRDDLITEIVRAGAAGLLDDAEMVSMITMLMIAGLEPASAISSGVLALLENPRELTRLRENPDLMAACVEEVLRFESPFRMLTPRFIDHPVELAGITIPAGELLLISAGAANRDPSRFPDPNQFDITRDTKGHLGFSHGSHRCLGAELGRMQTTVALTRLFARFPDTEMAIMADTVEWRPGMFMRRLHSLPVILR